MMATYLELGGRPNFRCDLNVLTKKSNSYSTIVSPSTSPVKVVLFGTN